MPDSLIGLAPPVCTRGARVALGDPLALAVRPGDGFAALEHITRIVPGADAPRWVEVERVVWPDDALVTLAWPGNDAALIVLARTSHGFCVRAVWGYSFGGLGVTLSVADVARLADETLLIALEAVATFNNPADATGAPTEHRRIVLAVAETRAAVVADTQPPGPFQGYHEHHWYFARAFARSGAGSGAGSGVGSVAGPGDPARPGDVEVVATADQDSMRWRFDPGSWTLVPLSTRPSRPEVRRSR